MFIRLVAACVPQEENEITRDIMASGDVANCRNLYAALLLLSAILLVPAESSMKSIEQLVVRWTTPSLAVN